ncbi:acyltransferase [Psychrobacter sp. I-STPA10]|uniref:acyltransferase n=1 Tax=Psychrobacter sp. I-STPA10 TaxID=2585769 RepID=UPI001E3D5452|nr:acyltransferase [Psychrobacter sp. I-STPA10]
MNNNLLQLYRNIKPSLYKKIYKNRFHIIDNGQHNTFAIEANNHIIGHCPMTIRKGCHNHIAIGKNGKFNQLKIDIDGNHNTVNIADEVKFSGHLLIVGDNLHIKIAAKTTAIDCYILARDKSVNIGSECMISRGIEIRATDVHKVYDLQTKQRLNHATTDIHIGDHVWIAANVTISKNVHIADGCIVAAGAFVNKPVHTPNCLIAGTPAKIVKTGIYWER